MGCSFPDVLRQIYPDFPCENTNQCIFSMTHTQVHRSRLPSFTVFSASMNNPNTKTSMIVLPPDPIQWDYSRDPACPNVVEATVVCGAPHAAVVHPPCEHHSLGFKTRNHTIHHTRFTSIPILTRPYNTADSVDASSTCEEDERKPGYIHDEAGRTKRKPINLHELDCTLSGRYWDTK